MVESHPSKSLGRLLAKSDETLQAAAARLGLLHVPVQPSGAGAGATPGQPNSNSTSITMNPPDPGRAVYIEVSLAGGTIFLDDERRVRALAKEIKRLITEDVRRGLAV